MTQRGHSDLMWPVIGHEGQPAAGILHFLIWSLFRCFTSVLQYILLGRKHSSYSSIELCRKSSLTKAADHRAMISLAITIISVFSMYIHRTDHPTSHEEHM